MQHSVLLHLLNRHIQGWSVTGGPFTREDVSTRSLTYVTHAYTRPHTDIEWGERCFPFFAMEAFWREAQAAISRMIAEMPPLSSFSMKTGDRFVDIRLEIKPETESVPNMKKKKPSPSRLRRNQRRLLMLLEKNKAAESSEPVNTGYKDGSTGEPLLTGATTSAIIKRWVSSSKHTDKGN